MTAPWNDWFHCNGNTYGTWLRGDPRGFRERHHRQHIDGDYKRPPPTGTHDGLLARSKQLLKRPPVYLDGRQRTVAANAMISKLLQLDTEPIAIAIDDHHFHLLARFRDHQPRHWVGRAKMHASMVLRRYGLNGKVWATRSRALPIKDRRHQLTAFDYIIAHAHSSVWTFRDPPPQPQ